MAMNAVLMAAPVLYHTRTEQDRVDVMQFRIARGRKIDETYSSFAFFAMVMSPGSVGVTDQVEARLHGITWLMAASFLGHTRVVEFLLECGADVNMRLQPATFAELGTTVDGIDMATMIQWDIRTKDMFGKMSAEELATGNQDVLALVLGKVAPNALDLAAIEGHQDIVRLLVAKGANASETQGLRKSAAAFRALFKRGLGSG
jgi:ankyrin repeat protein